MEFDVTFLSWERPQGKVDLAKFGWIEVVYFAALKFDGLW